MTFKDACKEIENISFIDPMVNNVIRNRSVKDRKQTLAIYIILEAAQKGELFSKEYVDQILWEKNMTLAQLNEIGKSFGEKMDDVKTIVTARWIEKRHGYFECSNCHRDTNKLDKHGYPIGQDVKHNYPKYCPHCGAYMLDKEEN